MLGLWARSLGRSVDEAIFLEEFEADDSPQMYKAFADIATIPEFYQWLEGPFYNALYTDATWGDAAEATYPGSLFGAYVMTTVPDAVGYMWAETHTTRHAVADLTS